MTIDNISHKRQRKKKFLEEGKNGIDTLGAFVRALYHSSSSVKQQICGGHHRSLFHPREELSTSACVSSVHEIDNKMKFMVFNFCWGIGGGSLCSSRVCTLNLECFATDAVDFSAHRSRFTYAVPLWHCIAPDGDECSVTVGT